MEAQTTVPSPVGEYYLRGVRETACGFKLAADSTFEFFFSYGALDRYGEGRWSIAGNAIIFNSKERPATDFALVTSSAGSKDKITIGITEANEVLRRYVHCKILGGGKEQEGVTNENGVIQFDVQPVDTIELLFEFCPEKKSIYNLQDTTHHSFYFKPEPWLMEVFFQGFRLCRTTEGLLGGHPFSHDASFTYEKTSH